MKVNSQLNRHQSPKTGISGIRYIFAGMSFLGFCVIYTLRVGINVAIVAMVNGTAVYNESSQSEECKGSNSSFYTTNGKTHEHQDGEFDWSSKLQHYVLGSFYIGYCITQIPGGRLAEMYSAKNVFGYGTVITAVLSLVTPTAARWNVDMLIFIRVVQGLAQGVTMPAMHSMLGKWLPECEKGFLSTVVYLGINIGTVVAMPLSAILCDSNLFGGWPSVFYIFGVTGCIWFIFWMCLISESPTNHPWITTSELAYIRNNQEIQHQKLPEIPWFRIMTSVPFLALVITQFGQDWCFYTLITDLPTFMDTILHFKIETNGLLSSMPYLLQTVVGCLVGSITDFCLRRNYCSKEFIRKFCNTMAGVATTFGLLGVCLSGCNIDLTIAMFTTAIGFGGFCFCGYMLSHLDMSPEYAGTLMGITNTISNLSGFIAPAVVGNLTQEYQTLHQWHIVFYIVVVIVSTTSLVFLFFSTTKKQDWVPKGLLDEYDEGNDVDSVKYGTMEQSIQFRIQ